MRKFNSISIFLIISLMLSNNFAKSEITVNCPPLFTECNINDLLPYPDFNAFLADGGLYADNCGGTEPEEFFFVEDVFNGSNCPEFVNRTYFFMDICGDTETCTQFITVDDQFAPFMDCPESIILNPGCAGPNIPLPFIDIFEFAENEGIVLDNCQFDEASFNLISETSDGLSGPETLTRIYEVLDFCGNPGQCSHQIIINEPTPLLITNPNGISLSSTGIQLSWDPIPDVFGYQIKGREYGSLPFGNTTTSNNYKNIGGLDPGTCYEWKVRAICVPTEPILGPFTDLQIVGTQNIVGPPAICTADGPLALNLFIDTDTIATKSGKCGARAFLVRPTILGDATGWQLTNNLSESNFEEINFPPGSTMVNWNLTDSSGFSLTVSYTLIVLDYEKPVIICPRPDQVISNGNDPFTFVRHRALASDNCGLVEVDHQVIEPSGYNETAHNGFLPGTYKIRYTASDQAGNSDFCDFNLTVLKK